MKSSDNLASTHKTIYISQTILIHGWHFFFMGWGGGGGVNILWYNILTPSPQWYKGMTTSKQNPMTALLYHFDHLQVFVDSISMLIVQIKFGWVGGVKILCYNIFPPPPSKNIQEQYFVNGIQLQLSFKTQNIYISQSILLGGWHFFLIGYGGGVNILWYNILTPPPPQWYKGKTTSKQYTITALLYHYDHLQIFGDTISM